MPTLEEREGEDGVAQEGEGGGASSAQAGKGKGKMTGEYQWEHGTGRGRASSSRQHQFKWPARWRDEWEGKWVVKGQRSGQVTEDEVREHVERVMQEHGKGGQDPWKLKLDIPQCTLKVDLAGIDSDEQTQAEAPQQPARDKRTLGPSHTELRKWEKKTGLRDASLEEMGNKGGDEYEVQMPGKPKLEPDDDDFGLFEVEMPGKPKLEPGENFELFEKGPEEEKERDDPSKTCEGAHSGRDAGMARPPSVGGVAPGNARTPGAPGGRGAPGGPGRPDSGGPAGPSVPSGGSNRPSNPGSGSSGPNNPRGGSSGGSGDVERKRPPSYDPDDPLDDNYDGKYDWLDWPKKK